mgnify:CR=1 FL=1
MSQKLNKYSSRITGMKSQGASQAMLYGVGLTDADMQKAQVGISSVWYEGNPCNMHLNQLSAKVKEGVDAAGLVGLRFNTIGVSDGISMGTEGMSYSLQSRDLIADSVRQMRAQTERGTINFNSNASLPDAIRRATSGERTVITTHGRPVAQLAPLDEAAPDIDRLIAADIEAKIRAELLVTASPVAIVPSTSRPPLATVSGHAPCGLQDRRARCSGRPDGRLLSGRQQIRAFGAKHPASAAETVRRVL